jgi:hypothetical protein
MERQPWFVIAGNLMTDVLRVYGPFNTYEEAQAWGDHHCSTMSFWDASQMIDPSTVPEEP